MKIPQIINYHSNKIKSWMYELDSYKITETVEDEKTKFFLQGKIASARLFIKQLRSIT